MPRHQDNPFIGPSASPAAEEPPRHGALGSDTRLFILRYLSNRPAGAKCAELALRLGLSQDVVGQVLRALKMDERIACDRAGYDSCWYIPRVRAEHESARPRITRTVQP